MARQRDPYAPPPMHHDRSGILVRLVIVAALIGVAFWGYTEYSQQNQTTAGLAQEEQTVADAGNTVTPEPTPLPESTAPATTPSTPAAQSPPQSAPTPAPAQDVPPPPPSTTIGTPPAG